MAKIRVHELSKQLNISNKDIIDTLGAKGIEIKSHMSNLDDSMVGIIKAKFGAKTAPKAEAPKAETPKPAAPKQEAPKAAPKTEQPKPETAKPAAAPKADAQKQNPSRDDNSAARQGSGNHVRFAREDRNGGKMNNNGNRVRFNNDRQGGSDRARFSNDRNQGDRNQGDRPRFGRDGQGDRNQSDRPRVGRDGQGDRPRFNRDGDRNQGGGRFGNGDRNQGGRGFNRDGGNRFSNRINMPFGKDDEDDSPAQKRAPFKRDRKDFDAKEMPGKDLKSQNRDNYNRDKNKPRKGNRRSPEEVEADISRLAKNVKNKPQKKQQAPQEDPDAIRTITLPEVVTLKELADAVSVTRQTIVAIERGDYNPTVRLCIEICKVLGKTLDELFWDS